MNSNSRRSLQHVHGGHHLILQVACKGWLARYKNISSKTKRGDYAKSEKVGMCLKLENILLMSARKYDSPLRDSAILINEIQWNSSCLSMMRNSEIISCDQRWSCHNVPFIKYVFICCTVGVTLRVAGKKGLSQPQLREWELIPWHNLRSPLL